MADVRPDLAVYKIVDPTAWAEMERTGAYTLSADDQRDGFVHFSRLGQVVETARRHFAEAGELVVLEVDTAPLIDFLHWEEGRGGELFPHLYGDFTLEEVRRHWRVAPRGDGWAWPEEIARA